MRANGRKRAVVVAALLVAVTGPAAWAGDLLPKIPIDSSKGSCVLPKEQMRRQHMQILKHRRDRTMYEGVRGGKRALSACLTCHMVKDEKTGKPVTVASPKHFCRVCHDYAAVQVDCWECHKSVPDELPGKQAVRSRKGEGSMFAQLMKFVGGRK